MTHSNLIFRNAHRSLSTSLSGVWGTARSVSCAALVLGLTAQANAQEGTPTPSAEPAAASVEDSSVVENSAPESPPASRGAPAVSDGSSEEEAPVETEPAVEPEAPVREPASGLSPEQNRALWPLTWKKSPGQGVAFGLEEGVWGGSWGQGLRITLPFASNFATTLRGIYLLDMADDVLTVDAGGRIDFVGRSDVLFNVMRLYGGGGVQVIAPVSNTTGKEVRVGGGGHFGFEFFCSPHYSFFLEVGGQGGTVSPGATVLAGIMVYPWTR